jgi:hypothetical protein
LAAALFAAQLLPISVAAEAPLAQMHEVVTRTTTATPNRLRILFPLVDETLSREGKRHSGAS